MTEEELLELKTGSPNSSTPTGLYPHTICTSNSSVSTDSTPTLATATPTSSGSRSTVSTNLGIALQSSSPLRVLTELEVATNVTSTSSVASPPAPHFMITNSDSLVNCSDKFNLSFLPTRKNFLGEGRHSTVYKGLYSASTVATISSNSSSLSISSATLDNPPSPLTNTLSNSSRNFALPTRRMSEMLVGGGGSHRNPYSSTSFVASIQPINRSNNINHLDNMKMCAVKRMVRRWQSKCEENL